MTTYVICDNCKGKFVSKMIQTNNLETNTISGCREKCPICKKMILVENRNLINE